MAATAVGVRPALVRLPPHFLRLSSSFSGSCASLCPAKRLSPFGCHSLSTVKWHRSLHFASTCRYPYLVLGRTDLVDASSSLSVSFPLVKTALFSTEFNRFRSSSDGANFIRWAKFATSGSPWVHTACLSSIAVDAADNGSFSTGFESVPLTVSESEMVPPTVQDPEDYELRNQAEPQQSLVRISSGKKTHRICYYHSQGLCAMIEDAEHRAKYSHEFIPLPVTDEDLAKVKAQPFDNFLVLDLEGMVEILEFPVILFDAKTLQVVDHFHRFVKPAKMKKLRMEDYIRNKYGRWGLERVWHDTAIPFTDVLPAFEKWLEGHGLWDPQIGGKLPTAAFVTCGNWDLKTKIPEQCVTSEIDLPPYFNEWINLKDIFFNFYKFRATGMLPMMKGLKMQVLGTHHVGLDDTFNITRVLQRMLVHGVPFQLTAKRKADDPKSVKFMFQFRIK